MDAASFIKNPNKWPAWPALPLKRRTTGEMETAYLWGDPVVPIKVYKGNIWSIKAEDPIIGEFDSVEELLAAGWEVD